MGIVLERARERFLDRRQQIRLQRERERQQARASSWLNLDDALLFADWRTLNPDEDDAA